MYTLIFERYKTNLDQNNLPLGRKDFFLHSSHLFYFLQHQVRKVVLRFVQLHCTLLSTHLIHMKQIEMMSSIQKRMKMKVWMATLEATGLFLVHILNLLMIGFKKWT